MRDDEMMKALANYTGTVTRCRPGYARGKRVEPVPLREGQRVDVRHERKALKDDETARWLSEHVDAIAKQRWTEREKERRNRERHLRQRQARARARQARVFNAAEAWFVPLESTTGTASSAWSAHGNTFTPLKLERTA
jgi:hypothetical protein